MSSAAFKSRARCLMLATVSTLAAPHAVVAQPYLCAAIRHGETAAAAARRITGDARNVWEPWFQIVDPSSSRTVPKGTYDSVRVGWHACVATGWTNASGASVAARPTGPTHDAYGHALGVLGAGDSNVALWALLLALIAIATHNADDYLERRKQMIETMRRFSDRFVHEFERPLITPGMPSPPIESRVRFAPHAARLEILLAPGAGHVYPNVTDHKRNLDYDVERVLHVLRERAVINGSPHMNGRWVVLPFHFKPATSQAGGR